MPDPGNGPHPHPPAASVMLGRRDSQPAIQTHRARAGRGFPSHFPSALEVLERYLLWGIFWGPYKGERDPWKGVYLLCGVSGTVCHCLKPNLALPSKCLITHVSPFGAKKTLIHTPGSSVLPWARAATGHPPRPELHLPTPGPHTAVLHSSIPVSLDVHVRLS